MAIRFTPDSGATSNVRFQPDDNAPPGNPVAAIGNTPDASPGSSPDNPAEGDLYGGNLARTQSSFGDVMGKKAILMNRGYKAVQQNKKGDMVAQSPNDGKWYKDQQGLSHPINWMEGHLGGALPTVGMGAGAVGGAALAGTAGLPTGPGAAALGYAGGVAGAGAGAAGGEAARVGIGKLMGVNQGDVTPQLEDEAKQGALAEAVGKPVGEAVAAIPGVKQGANWVADRTIRPVLAKLSNLATFGSVDTAAAKHLLQRPDQVMGSLEKGNVANVGAKAAEELAQTDSSMGQMISKARGEFADKYGTSPVDTQHMVDTIENVATKNKPNAYGQSAMDQGDFDELGRTMQSLDKSTINNGTGNIGSSASQGPQAATQDAGSLQRTADYLQSQAKGFYDKTGASKFKTDKAASTAALTAGQIKAALHKMDPTGLGVADSTFSKFANAAPMLKGVENPATAESWAGNLFGKNKTAYQDAAQKYIPNSYEDLADIGAYKSFGNDPLNKVLGPAASAAPLLRTAGIMEGGNMLLHAAGNPLSMLAGGTLATGAALSSPLVQRQLLGTAGKVINNKVPSMALKTLNPWGLGQQNQGENK